MELLAPSGDPQSFFAAINNGANAVYMGLKDFSARKNAENFSLGNIGYYVAYAHNLGVKVYITANTLVKNNELSAFFDMIKEAYLSGVDAFIIQDVFLGKKLKKYFPDIVLHLSTQAGINNLLGAKYAKEHGFSRVILARETNIAEVKEIAEFIETEVFVQGAMCTCFSGHCYMSAYIGGNSGNRGFCKQPCRQKYNLESKKGKGDYVISLSDLCLAENIEELKKIGVRSVKIEGRMRSPEYVSAAVDLYRRAIDGEKYNLSAIKRTYNRGNYTKGYINGIDKNIVSDKIQNHCGLKIGSVKVINKDEIIIKTDEKFVKGDAFKIIRGGFEVGNAVCVEDNVIKFKGNIKIGDDVMITKDVKLSESFNKVKKRDVFIKAVFKIGERAELSSNDITVFSDEVLTEAKTSPLTIDEILSCLNKTDVYPFNVKSEIVLNGNVFIAKSQLNKLRKTLYEKMFYSLVKHPEIFDYNNDFKCFYNFIPTYDNLILSTDVDAYTNTNDAVVFCPKNYFELSVKKNDKPVYLYVPSFITGKDEELIRQNLSNFDGIYADGICGLQIAKECNVPVIAGLGLNVFNVLDLNQLYEENIIDIVCSQELSSAEFADFSENTYRFTYGSIRLMELLYCPFGHNCQKCNSGDINFMTDEFKHKFLIRRYKINGRCVFEVYNGQALKIKQVKHNLFNNVVMSDFGGELLFTKGNDLRGVK